MTWHAVDAVDRAVDATQRFLLPFEAAKWSKLAFLTLLMAGGTAGVSSALGSSFGISGTQFVAEADREAVARSLGPAVETTLGLDDAVNTALALDDAVLIGTLAGAGIAWVPFGAVSVALRLVFYDALATSTVALRRPFRARFRQALGLFGFTTAVSVVAAAPAVAVAVVASPEARRALGVLPGGISGLSPVAIGAGTSLSVGIALIGVAVVRFAFEFVAPAMVARDLGVLAAWRRVWGAFRGSRAELLAYVVVHAVIAGGVGTVQASAVALAGGVAAAFALVALVVAAVPLGGIGALVGTPAGLIALATVSLCALAVLVALVLPIRLVARTYLIAYEVSVLAGIDSGLVPLAPKLVESGREEPIDAPRATEGSGATVGSGVGDEPISSEE